MAIHFDEYGKWPVDPVAARKKQEMVKISPSQWKHFVHGEKDHVHLSLIASSNYAQVGYIQIPPGNFSELENHAGDEVIYMVKGKMAIRIVWTDDFEADAAQANHPHYEIRQGESFLIPAGYVHQYINFLEDDVVFYFGIGSDF
jgi:quercetin dioxygenase-like cupin family protein